jgi:hypothetical protein
MVLEIAKLVALVLCMLSLWAVFHTAFLVPAADFEQRTYDSLAMLALAAGISLAGGLLFRETKPRAPNPRLAATLPVQVFFWVAGLILILFIVSWYLETYVVFYRDIRPWA